MKYFCIIVSVFLFGTSTAQIGIYTNTPHSSSILEIKSSNKGFLLPRIALVGSNDNTTILAPANSLIIFNTATRSGANAILPGYYFWSSTNNKWLSFDGENSWDKSGNNNTNPTSNFLGTTNANDLVFKTNNTEKFRITSTGIIGIGTSNPAECAAIDATSTNLGFLFPRMTETQRNAIADAKESLQIYNTTREKFQVKSPTIPKVHISNLAPGSGSFLGFHQSFTITVPCLIHKITTFFSNVNGYGNLSFTLYKNLVPGGPVLFSTGISLGYAVGAPLEVTINPPVRAEAGEIFSFGTGVSLQAITDGNSYLGGKLYDSGLPNVDRGDLRFIVEIKPLDWIDLHGDKTTTAEVAGTSWLQTGNSGTNLANNFIGTTENNQLIFATNNEAKLQITAAGNIGLELANSPSEFEFDYLNRSKKIVLSSLDDSNNHNFNGFGTNLDWQRYQTRDNTTDHVFFAGVNATTSNELMRIKGNGNIGIGTDTPDGILDIATTTNNALFVQAPNTQIRLQETDNANKQWQLSVDNGNLSITENGVGTAMTINDNSVNNTLVIESNTVKANKIQIGGATTTNKINHGQATVGLGIANSNEKSITVTFPNGGFATVPKIVATAANETPFADIFSVTATNVTATSATLIVYRVDSNPPTNGSFGWSQDLKVNWWTFE